DSDYQTFATFKKAIIDRSSTRVLAFLNITGEGYQGGAYEENSSDRIAVESAKLALESREHIVGFKVDFTGPDWTPVDQGVAAGNLADMPIMLDGGRNHPQPSLQELFTQHLRPGDIYTHTYTIIEDINARETIVDLQTNQLRPYVLEAQRKGIVFDVGHGSAFRYSQALLAEEGGHFSDRIGTALSVRCTDEFMKDMMNVMSKFLTLGMRLQEVIKASTWRPAQAIKREELGHLSRGAVADVVVFN